MKKIVLTFGLIAGAILAGTFIATLPFHDAMSNDTAMVVGYTSMVLAFLLTFFGVRSYRDNVGGGTISFARAFAVGGLITLVASTCYVLTWEVMYFGGKSDYLEQYQVREVESMRKQGASEAEIAAKTAEMQQFAEMYKNPVINTAMTYMEPLPVGLVMTLVAAGILSRRRKDQAQLA
ncbi:MAG: DUF4199 domain-containing protein [Gemmatimonadetes bacterium]|nr:DUF4199 domain-containing protein [Gemmatimonadota bacterium]